MQKVTKQLKKRLVDPENKLEHKIKDIWAKVVGHTNIGINCDYHEFGGSSLLIMSVLEKLSKEYGINLIYNDSLKTIKLLSKAVQDAINSKNKSASTGDVYA